MQRVSRHAAFPFRRALVIAAQLAFVVAANRAAFALRFDGDEPAWAMTAWMQMLPWLVAIRALTFAPFKLYNGLWRYTGIYDLKAIVQAVAVSSVLFAAVASSAAGPPVYPRSIFIIDAVLLVIALGGVRILRRLSTEFSAGAHGKRLLVFGAGDAGATIVQDMLTRTEYAYQPVAFVDDDAAKVGRYIHGVPVVGTRADFDRILEDHRPDEVLIAVPSAEPALVRSIVRALEPHKIPIKTLPRLAEMFGGKVNLAQIRTLELGDLLARLPVGLDQSAVRALLANRRILVTGAGGSIGGELCRQIADMAPSSLVMLDRYENGLHAICLELQDRAPSSALHSVVGDITDAARVHEVFSLYRPEIVFHAAAHKHVPLMEGSPCEAIKNNVTGSRILAEAAKRHGVDRFILISTDKAVNPSSMMGASKRLAELVIRAHAAGSSTSFSAVRFGNVLGSNGSVVPRFIEQIRNGGPVTVTHPDVRRYFMLVAEAVQLVLHAAAQARGGATYVLEMGEQVKLIDLARQLIRLAGFVPEEDIAIKFVGLRPGEKLWEELVGAGETVQKSRVKKVLRVTERARPSAQVLAHIHEVERCAARSDAAGVFSHMAALLPAYAEAHPAVAVPAAPGPPLGDAADAVPGTGERDTPAHGGVEGNSRTPDLDAVDAAVHLSPLMANRRLATRTIN